MVQAVVQSVFNLLAAGRPLQIRDVVIRLRIPLVVDLGKPERVGDERLCNESCDLSRVCLSAPIEIDPAVAPNNTAFQ